MDLWKEKETILKGQKSYELWKRWWKRLHLMLTMREIKFKFDENLEMI